MRISIQPRRVEGSGRELLFSSRARLDFDFVSRLICAQDVVAFHLLAL
jgi:hypothetical protein